MRLIDADELEKIYMRNSITDTVTVGEKTVLQNLRAAPTIDAVHIVRCKDCKHYENHRLKVFENCVRNERYIPMKPDDFCSYGERRKEDV